MKDTVQGAEKSEATIGSDTDQTPIKNTSADTTLPREERERLWLIENAKAIEAQNEYVAKHGLPLAKYRQF
jgi:post-segregation antitoxin (ccd killing protein)